MAKSTKGVSKKSFIIVLTSVTLLLILAGFYFLSAWLKTKNNLVIRNSGEKIEFSDNVLLEDFPADFPMYPQMKLISSWKTKEGKNAGLSAIFESDADTVKISNYYAENLQKNNWTILSQTEKSGGYVVTFNKDDYQGFLGVSDGVDSKASISVTIWKEK